MALMEAMIRSLGGPSTDSANSNDRTGSDCDTGTTGVCVGH